MLTPPILVNNMPFYAKSAGHVTRPYQGISLPKSKYPGYEVGLVEGIFINYWLESWKEGIPSKIILRNICRGELPPNDDEEAQKQTENAQIRHL